MAEVVRAAVQRLRGLRLCEDGREEGAVTHLVIGAERRTIKVPKLGARHGATRVEQAWLGLRARA